MRSDYYQNTLLAIHDLLLEHEITQEYLTCTEIRMDGESVLPDSTFELELPSKTSLSGIEFSHLFSVFNGSRVHQQPSMIEGPDGAPPGVYFTIINHQIIQNQHKNKFGLVIEASGDAEIFVQGLFIDHYFLDEHKTKASLGTVAFALSAITAYRAGIRDMALVAAGGKGYGNQYIGYKVWPKLGFDALLLPDETNGSPELSLCNTVQDVMKVDPGWWDANGSQRLMRFDLTPDSISWRKLLSYLHARLGI